MAAKRTADRITELEARIAKLEGTAAAYVGVVMDASSSMAGYEEATISGFNEYIEGLRKQAEEDGIPYRVTLTQFDTTYKTLYENEELAKVKPLNRDTYITGGATALYDAIGDSIRIIDKLVKPGDAAIILIMTDGEENSSRRFDRHKINDLIKSKETTGKWTFAYIGADVDAWTGGTSIGIPAGNTFRMPKTNSGLRGMYSSLAAATSVTASSGAAVQDFASHLDGATTDNTSANSTFKVNIVKPDDKGDEDGVGVSN